MQNKLLFRLVLAIIPLSAIGQSSHIRTGSIAYHLLDRLEIKTRFQGMNQSFVRPFSPAAVNTTINYAKADSLAKQRLTAVDRFNLQGLVNETGPGWDRNSDSSGNGALKRNFISVLPVARLSYARESGDNDDPFMVSAGLTAKGLLFGKVGFQLFGTANSERLPAYMDHWLSRYPAVPGIGRFKSGEKGNVSYMDLRGSVRTSVTKYIDLELGYDRIFLGNGYRSLFLSDLSNNMGFFRVNTKIWKLNFQSLYIKLSPQDHIVNKPNDKKFLRINTLGIDATPWLNISFFDAVVLGRERGFDLNYILPVTFLRAMEQQSGSPDNALFGLNVKANLAHRVQVYAQGLLDEFKLDEIKAGSGWWANKFGYQFGVKYVDAFGLPNLDLQLETNKTRPFTYSHFDSVSNYSHSNQPLAHPLGANFHEFIGIVRYQPANRLHINARVIFYKQGLDSLGFNTGNNVLSSYNSRPRSYGWEVGSGDRANCLYISGEIAYELMRGLFIDATVVRRSFSTSFMGDLVTTMASFGLRWNIARRQFDY